MADKTKFRVRMAAGIALLYLLVFIKAGFEVAAWFIACGVTGYLNSFVAAPLLISMAIRKIVNQSQIALSILALAGSCFLIYFGYTAPLVLCTLSFLLIYWIVFFFEQRGLR